MQTIVSECEVCGLVKPVDYNDNGSVISNQFCPNCGSTEWSRCD